MNDGKGLAPPPGPRLGSPLGRLVDAAHELYFGFSPLARRFRYALLAFDLATVAYVIATTVGGTAVSFQMVDVMIGCVLTLDLVARTVGMRAAFLPLKRVAFWLDVVVIVALFGSALVPDLDFARILRVLRILRAYRLGLELRRASRWFRRNEDTLESGLNLFVFVFIVASITFITENGSNAQVKTFLDALYFTIATLTTTGFGDITPDGTDGRLLSIATMTIGVGLFLRLLQTVFRPLKVSYDCPRCGLSRHDVDAVHCKACGEFINIPNEGAV